MPPSPTFPFSSYFPKTNSGSWRGIFTFLFCTIWCHFSRFFRVIFLFLHDPVTFYTISWLFPRSARSRVSVGFFRYAKLIKNLVSFYSKRKSDTRLKKISCHFPVSRKVTQDWSHVILRGKKTSEKKQKSDMRLKKSRVTFLGKSVENFFLRYLVTFVGLQQYVLLPRHQ